MSAQEWLDRADALAQKATEPLPDGARMDAYYYGFNRTGVGPVDAVLSAVAVAGKGAHHTSDWQDDGADHYGYYENWPGLATNSGGDAQGLIQLTAQESAEKVSAALALLPQAVAALRAVLDLHKPWYEVNGVRHDHTGLVDADDPPADHVCRVGGDDFDDACNPEFDEHYALACVECRGATEEGTPGYDLWPCATVRCITEALR